MNLPDLNPYKAAARGVLAVAIVGIFVVGLIAAINWANDPLGWGKKRLAKAETTAVVNGQQAASNAAGARINDRRATNVAKIEQTAQEARHAVQNAPDYDTAARDYLAGLQRLRDDGAAAVGDPGPDAGRSHPDPEP